MSGWVVGIVVLHNFGPFTHAEIDFSQPGLTVIEGQIDDVPGCSSNGAGKSFLLDAIPWALYDRCLREKYHGDEVVRLLWLKTPENPKSPGHWVDRDDGDGTWVEVNLTDGSDTMKVTKHRRDPLRLDKKFLVFNGKDITRGTNPMTTQAIERMLGMDFTLFANGPMFGVRDDVRSFLSATDGSRKDILDKLLGFEIYGEAQKVANAEIKTLTESMAVEEDKRLVLNTRIGEQEASLVALQTSDVIEDVAFKVKLMKAKVRRLRIAESEAEADLEANRADLDAEEVEAREIVADYDARQRDWMNTGIPLIRKENDLRRDHAKAQGTTETCQGNITKWSNLKAGKACVVCKQTVMDHHVKEVLAGLNTELTTAKERESSLSVALEAATTASADHAAQEPVQPTLAMYQAETKVMEAREEAVRSWREKRVNAESALLQLMERSDGYAAQVTAVTDALEAAKMRLATTEAAWLALRRRCDLLQFWVEGFGNGGVKSLLMEAELPEINRGATKAAQRLLGPGTRVGLTATKELKSRATREEIGIDVLIPGCTRTFNGASKGQKHRLNLSLLLSFRDILEARALKSFKQMFADELFDGLDKVGCKFIIELLKEIAAKVPVCIITHDPLIKTAADRVIIAHHTESSASLLAHSAVSAITTEANAKVPPRGRRTKEG